MRYRLEIVLLFVLVILPVAVFWQISGHRFLNYDDPDYVTENPMVLGGLRTEAISEAFSEPHAGNYHPLTWLSHMVDVEVFGLDAGKHHLVSLGIHVFNGILLFLLLRKLTGAVWRSFFVAGLFALHPLHVESVAWISERKDLLSGMFFMLTLGAYSYYVKATRANCERTQSPDSTRLAVLDSRVLFWYVLSLVSFAMGLMSKPMLVTLPCVLLLLDYWPMKRFSLEDCSDWWSKGRKLLIEKIPFFALVIVSCYVTFLAQRKGGAVADWEALPLESRIANAIVAYGIYLLKTIWPAGLAPFYPLPAQTAALHLLAATGVVSGISFAAVRLARRAPFFVVGWLWFIGMLVPVIGIIQVGMQALADRYTYLPLIGIFIAAVWGSSELLRTRRSRTVLACTGGILLTGFAWLTFVQASYWSDNLSLFSHALRVTQNNHIAHQNVGIELAFQGKIPEAEKHFAQAVAVRPTFAEAHANLGLALVYQGKIEEGIASYRRAIALRPDYEKPHFNLGRALEMTGDTGNAMTAYESALDLNPNSPEANKAMGRLLLLQGNFLMAEERFKKAASVIPGDVDAVIGLCQSYIARGDRAAAIQELERATASRGDLGLLEMLGMLLAETGRAEEGIECLKKVVSARSTAGTHYKLGLAYVMKGDASQAIAQLEQAIKIDPGFALGYNDLAWIYATAPDASIRNGEKAVSLALKSCALAGDAEPMFWGTLDAAYAEHGDFERALETARKTQSLAAEKGQEAVVEAAKVRLKMYQRKQPYHQE